MRLAETVTFGGSAFDRCADLRGQPETLDVLRGRADAGHIALWRGKILLDSDSRVVRLPGDAEILAHGTETGIFLGCEDSVPLFAHDVSPWIPHEGEPDTLGAFHDPSRQAVSGVDGGAAFCELRGVMSDLNPRDAELAATAKAVLGWHESHRYCSRCGTKSELAEGGWRRDCPDCGGQHFPRTDPVVIMLITHGNSVLLGRSHHWPEGMYSLLAGFVEPGETLEAAVRREVAEEAGIRVGPVEYLASQPWPFPASLMFGCRGEALNRDIQMDPKELEDAIWLTREELLDVVAGEHPKIRAPRMGAIAGFILHHWLMDRLD